MYHRRSYELACAVALIFGLAAGCGPTVDDSTESTDESENGADTGTTEGSPDTTTDPSSDASTDTAADGQTNDNTEPAPESFAFASTISGDENNTTYVRYLDKLDAGEVSLEEAREYSGYATIGAVGEMFFVAEGNAPKITRYEVGDGGSLSENGTISFSQYVDAAPLYGNTFVNETKAYLEKEDTGRITWNPQEMKIEGSDSYDIAKERGNTAAYQGFRRATVVRDGLVFQPFNWAGPDYYEYTQNSKIAVIDTETDEVQKMIDAPCPGLGVGSRDDEGNIYFTNWVSTAAAPVIEGESATHSPCTVRIDAGETSLNEEWTRTLSDYTGGRAVTAMRIIEGSTAIAAVLDEERVDPDENTDPQKITYANNWELWRLDLEEGDGSKIPGIGYIAGGFYAFKFGDRTVVALPDADYASTTVYEIPAEGEAVELFNTDGWVYQLVGLE